MKEFKKSGGFNSNRGNGGFSRSGFAGRRGGSDRGDSRDKGRSSMMHVATCDACHKQCEVPFRPMGNKPVYCSNCFEGGNKREGSTGRFEERGDDRRGGDRGGFERKSFDRRPERPEANNGKQFDDLKREIATLSEKIDSLVRALETKPAPEEAPKKVTRKAAAKKETASKKAAAKKK